MAFPIRFPRLLAFSAAVTVCLTATSWTQDLKDIRPGDLPGSDSVRDIKPTPVPAKSAEKPHADGDLQKILAGYFSSRQKDTPGVRYYKEQCSSGFFQGRQKADCVEHAFILDHMKKIACTEDYYETNPNPDYQGMILRLTQKGRDYVFSQSRGEETKIGCATTVHPSALKLSPEVDKCLEDVKQRNRAQTHGLDAVLAACGSDSDCKATRSKQWVEAMRKNGWCD